MEVIYVDEEEKGQKIDSLGTPELADRPATLLKKRL